MQITLNEGFKALLREVFPDRAEGAISVFSEALSQKATNETLSLSELKARAIDELKGEIATKDFVRAEIAEVRAEIAEVEKRLLAEIHKSKIEIIKWVFGLQFATLALIGAMLKMLL